MPTKGDLRAGDRMKRVMVSGGFDPLHIGHIELFERAKELGDWLIVAVNSDEFLNNKKGFVFMPKDERKAIISKLRMVDEVVDVIDDDMTCCKTLEKYRPDIFANGGDRFNYEVSERDVCKKLGIEMVDGLGEKIQSSSELAKRINKNT